MQYRPLPAHPQREALRHTGTELLGEAIERRLLHGVVLDLLLLHHFARHIAGIAQAVDQTELQCLFAGPDQTREQLRMPLDLEPVAAPFFHAVDELLVGGIQHLLPELGLLGLLRLERIEERLVLAGGIDAPLDTELLHGADETEAGRRHTDGADQAGNRSVA